MPGKGKKIYCKSITAYLDSKGDSYSRQGVSSKEAREETSGFEEQPVTLSTIRAIIVQEVGKTEVEFRQFKEGACKALDALEQKVDSRFGNIVQKSETLDDDQREPYRGLRKLKVTQLSKSAKLDTTLCRVEENYKYLETKSEKLRRIIEDVDNNC